MPTLVYTAEQMNAVVISHRQAKTWYATTTFQENPRDTSADTRKVGLDSSVSDTRFALVNGPRYRLQA